MSGNLARSGPPEGIFASAGTCGGGAPRRNFCHALAPSGRQTDALSRESRTPVVRSSEGYRNAVGTATFSIRRRKRAILDGLVRRPTGRLGRQSALRKVLKRRPWPAAHALGYNHSDVAIWRQPMRPGADLHASYELLKPSSQFRPC
jgi:hypothetical protein